MANRTFADAAARAAYSITPEEAATRAAFLQADTGVQYIAVRNGAGLENWQRAFVGQVMQKLSKAVGWADLTDADGSQTFAFDSALPATAVVVGASINVTEAFSDGAAGVFTADVGINAADIDQFLDGNSLAAIARVGAPLGVAPCGYHGGETPAITVLATVNVTNATVGALVAEVYYFEAANL